MADHWRKGNKLGRTLYLNDVCIGIVDAPWIATRIVAAMNAVGEPHEEALPMPARAVRSPRVHDEPMPVPEVHMPTETKAEEVTALEPGQAAYRLFYGYIGNEDHWATERRGVQVQWCAVESALIELGRQEAKRSERESREWKERLDAVARALEVPDAIDRVHISGYATSTLRELRACREKLAAAERALEAADRMHASAVNAFGCSNDVSVQYTIARNSLRSDRAKADAENSAARDGHCMPVEHPANAMAAAALENEGYTVKRPGIPSAGRYVPHEGDAVQGYEPRPVKLPSERVQELTVEEVEAGSGPCVAGRSAVKRFLDENAHVFDLEQRVRRLERREGIDRWAVDERAKGGRG